MRTFPSLSNTAISSSLTTMLSFSLMSLGTFHITFPTLSASFHAIVVDPKTLPPLPGIGVTVVSVERSFLPNILFSIHILSFYSYVPYLPFLSLFSFFLDDHRIFQVVHSHPSSCHFLFICAEFFRLLRSSAPKPS